MDWPSVESAPLNAISPFSGDSIGDVLGSQAGINAATSGALTANQAYYYPFQLAVPATAVKMSVITGSSAVGNIDVGIYDWQGNRLVNSGSTAQGTINVLQEINTTDLAMLPGRYFMALQPSGAATVFRNAPADELVRSVAPMFIQAVGSFGLPSTATFTQSTEANPPVICMAVHFDTLV